MNLFDPETLSQATLTDLVKEMREQKVNTVTLSQSYENGELAWIAIIARNEVAAYINEALDRLDREEDTSHEKSDR